MNCSEYAYAGLYAFMTETTGSAPLIWDLLSVVYYKELGTFSDRNANSAIIQSSAYWAGKIYPGPQAVAIQALTRNYFDKQSGACRYNVAIGTYDCRYEYMIEWLSGIQGFYNEASPDINDATMQTTITVKLGELFGLDETQFAGFINRIRTASTTYRDKLGDILARQGAFAHDVAIQRTIEDNFINWTADDGGQGGGVPSTWGNVNHSVGQNYVLTIEQPIGIIVNNLPDGSIEYGVYSSGPSTCTYVAVITTSDGRANVSIC